MDSAELLRWAIAHPLVTVLAATAVPIVAVAVRALFGREQTPTAPARDDEANPSPARAGAPVELHASPHAAPQAAPHAAPHAAPYAAPQAAPRQIEPMPATEPDFEAEPEFEAEAEAEAEPEADAEPEAEPEFAPARAAAPPRVSLRDRLARTSEGFVGKLGGLIGGRTVDAALLAELEALLLTADLGVATAEDLLQTVKKNAIGGDATAVRRVLRDAILAKLERVEPKEPTSTDGLRVILVLGVNGSGKTTSIGKLAARYVREGKQVILGAGDTFRAAAIEQLQIWGERVGCEVIAAQPGSDPTAVAFDTVKAARARGADVAIIDTAGRLQTKKPLMEELAKLSRVLGREVEGAPHQTLLVLDANTGQNAISQARLFAEVTQVTDLVLTKLDGTAKGGVIIGLADQLGIPVRYVGVGEAIEDLRDFDAADFVDALFQES